MVQVTGEDKTMLYPHKLAHKSDLVTVSRERSLKKVPMENDSLSHLDIGPDDDEPPPDPNVLLEQYNFHRIHEKVKRRVSFLVKLVHPDVLNLELEDIAQEVSFHFWLRVQKGERIYHLDAFVARMIQNQYLDEIRSRKRTHNPQLLSMLADGSIQDDKALITAGSGMTDPALEYERKQSLAHFLHQIAYAVSKLPARQKLAMTCELLEKVDNLAWMTDALMIYGVDTQVQWPEDKKAKQRLQANLSAARLAIARCLHIDVATLPTKRHARS